MASTKEFEFGSRSSKAVYLDSEFYAKKSFSDLTSLCFSFTISLNGCFLGSQRPGAIDIKESF